jgi:hypothetical protein
MIHSTLSSALTLFSISEAFILSWVTTVVCVGNAKLRNIKGLVSDVSQVRKATNEFETTILETFREGYVEDLVGWKIRACHLLRASAGSC